MASDRSSDCECVDVFVVDVSPLTDVTVPSWVCHRGCGSPGVCRPRHPRQRGHPRHQQAHAGGVHRLAEIGAISTRCYVPGDLTRQAVSPLLSLVAVCVHANFWFPEIGRGNDAVRQDVYVGGVARHAIQGSGERGEDEGRRARCVCALLCLSTPYTTTRVLLSSLLRYRRSSISSSSTTCWSRLRWRMVLRCTLSATPQVWH